MFLNLEMFFQKTEVWFVKYIIVCILPPFGSWSYAPASPSLVPVNRLAYYLTVQSLFSLFFSILRFDHEVKPIGRPKRGFPARRGFLGVGRSQTDKSLSLYNILLYDIMWYNLILLMQYDVMWYDVILAVIIILLINDFSGGLLCTSSHWSWPHLA